MMRERMLGIQKRNKKYFILDSVMPTSRAVPNSLKLQIFVHKTDIKFLDQHSWVSSTLKGFERVGWGKRRDTCRKTAADMSAPIR